MHRQRYHADSCVHYHQDLKHQPDSKACRDGPGVRTNQHLVPVKAIFVCHGHHLDHQGDRHSEYPFSALYIDMPEMKGVVFEADPMGWSAKVPAGLLSKQEQFDRGRMR